MSTRFVFEALVSFNKYYCCTEATVKKYKKFEMIEIVELFSFFLYFLLSCFSFPILYHLLSLSLSPLVFQLLHLFCPLLVVLVVFRVLFFTGRSSIFIVHSATDK